jgi:hypothetical protein
MELDCKINNGTAPTVMSYITVEATVDFEGHFNRIKPSGYYTYHHFTTKNTKLFHTLCSISFSQKKLFPYTTSLTGKNLIFLYNVR